MKEGWTYKKLGEVCETLNGLWKGKKPPFVNVGVIRNANFTKDFTLRYDNVEYLDVEEKQYVKRKLQRGDLIIEKSGGSEKQPVGRAVLFDKENGEFSFSNFTSVLRVKNGILQSRFLYIYLLFIYKRGDTLKMQKATTGIHNIEFDKYLNIDIPILPFAQQQRIVSHLDAVFAHIDALKANAEKQLVEARQLFQAELTECMRPKEGWEEKTLGEVCRIERGGSPRPIKAFITDAPNGLNWIKIGDTDPQGKYIYSTKEKIKPEGLKKSRWVEEDEFLLSNSMSFGRPYILKTNGCIHDGWLVLRDYQKNLFIDFFYYMLLSSTIQEQFKKKAQGSTVSNLNTDRVASVNVTYPSLVKQRSIVTRLDALSENVRKLEKVKRKTLAECDALKQAMLKEVFE